MRFDGSDYEERITLWQAESSDAALAHAEHEAVSYAAIVGGRYIGLAQAFHLDDPPDRQGAEIFSLIRESTFGPQEYLDRFFDSGSELQSEPPP